MYKKYVLFLFVLFIIPTGISWKVWLNMWPELEVIAMCESSLNPTARHFNDNGTIDRGLFQINSKHNLPLELVYDPYWSIAFAIDKYVKGELDIWVCHRILTKNTGRILNL